MLEEETLNASVEANNSCAVNHTISPYHVCQKASQRMYFAPERYDVFVMWIVFLVYFVLYALGFRRLFKYSNKDDSWYLIFHWLFVSCLSLLFFLPTDYSIVFFFVKKEDRYGWPKHFSRYLLTLYAYVLVSMALFSYNAVFKTFFRTPLSCLQRCMFFVGLYIMSSFSTRYCIQVYGWVESYDCDMICYASTWMFSRYPDQSVILALIVWNHLTPAILIIPLLREVKKELLRRNEFDLFNREKNYSLCLGDRKIIALSYFACQYYAASSMPLVFREIAKSITKSKAIDNIIPYIFEVLPFHFILLESFFFIQLELYESETIWNEFKFNTGISRKRTKQS
ncbi:uncharacterized protein TNIN_405951 [Trichonephila inaurata madagascariensis]|uniref:Uncharacterized protein n=1 Tax=Trichonephila inaurata madagascariensis TaxID=2747483 RepID=A0A8X7CR46_9ARAC|nr:uncharacterized protein TNIN_405951 [Trichonephila inaurata madagascariensis]